MKLKKPLNEVTVSTSPREKEKGCPYSSACVY